MKNFHTTPTGIRIPHRHMKYKPEPCLDKPDDTWYFPITNVITVKNKDTAPGNDSALDTGVKKHD